MKYADRQAMMTPYTPRPTVAPWRYAITVLLSRSFAFFLAFVDALISYRGLLDLEMDQFSSLVVAAFIGIFQASVAIALTSGHPIGANFEARFMTDKGAMGSLKRVLGVIVILCIGGMYLVDVFSNVVALNGGFALPESSSDSVKLLLAVVMSLALTFGDEILHVFTDENEVAMELNRVVYDGQTHEAALQNRYQSHYMKAAGKTADNLGKEHGEHWRPTPGQIQQPPRKRKKPKQ